MKSTKIKAFIYENGVRVEFFPISNVPGFTHKVYVLDASAGKYETIAKDWFTPEGGLFKINQKAADYYYAKHVEKKEVK